MISRRWLCLGLSLAGCASTSDGPVFPAAVPGGWNLKSSQTFPIERAPDAVRKVGAQRCWSATYAGPGSATAEVYELATSALGLEMVQQWRPAADTVVWYTPRYFIVVKWQSQDRSAVSALVRGLQKQFSAQK